MTTSSIQSEDSPFIAGDIGTCVGNGRARFAYQQATGVSIRCLELFKPESVHQRAKRLRTRDDCGHLTQIELDVDVAAPYQ